MDLRVTALMATIALAVLSIWPTEASATHLSCGETITQDTTLDSDLLDCPGDGIVIGADNITLDLNGHTIDGSGLSGCNNSGKIYDGVRDPAGHDGVTIENGTIQDFWRGITGGFGRSVLRD